MALLLERHLGQRGERLPNIVLLENILTLSPEPESFLLRHSRNGPDL